MINRGEVPGDRLPLVGLVASGDGGQLYKSLVVRVLLEPESDIYIVVRIQTRILTWPLVSDISSPESTVRKLVPTDACPAVLVRYASR